MREFVTHLCRGSMTREMGGVRWVRVQQTLYIYDMRELVANLYRGFVTH